MSDSEVRVAPDSTGKRIDNEEVDFAGTPKYRQRTQIAGATTLEIARVNQRPSYADRGLVTKQFRNRLVFNGIPISATRDPVVWDAPVISGTGALSFDTNGFISIATGSTASSKSHVSSAPEFSVGQRSPSASEATVARMFTPQITRDAQGAIAMGLFTVPAVPTAAQPIQQGFGFLWHTDGTVIAFYNLNQTTRWFSTVIATPAYRDILELVIAGDVRQWLVNGVVVATYTTDTVAVMPLPLSYIAIAGAAPAGTTSFLVERMAAVFEVVDDGLIVDPQYPFQAARVLTADPAPADAGLAVRIVKSYVPTFRGRVNTFRTPGRAGTTGQKIFALHNATASPRKVHVNQISVDMVATVIKAVTVLPPVIRIRRFTAVPTNGTVLTKGALDNLLTSDAAITAWGDASADSALSGTALTITIPAGAAGASLAQAYAPRLITAVGYEMFDREEFLEEEDVILGPLEGIVVFLDYTLTTQNPATDMWIVGCDWDEALT